MWIHFIHSYLLTYLSVKLKIENDAMLRALTPQILYVVQVGKSFDSSLA